MTSDPVTILLRHNDWANRALLERCAALSPEQMRRRFEIGPGSLHDALVHILGCMERWADRVAGRALRPSPEGAEHAIADLRPRFGAATDDLAAIAADLAMSGRGGEEVTIEFRRDDGASIPVTFTRHAALVHCLVHGAHHRAQCLNMLRQLGVRPLPDLDVIDWQHETERP